MFTGIVEEIGKIERIERGSESIRLTVRGAKIFEDMHIGDSIAVNGVCLTVTTFTGHTFTADVMAESIKMTTLDGLTSRAPVNLERAMAANGRFGGHMVAGHVDGIGHIESMKKVGNSIVFRISASKEVMEFVIYKGSITVDGASLTVSSVGTDYFEISIIPHTISETILKYATVGTKVNLETDIFGRYVRHFMKLDKVDLEKKESAGLTMDTLVSNGFL